MATAVQKLPQGISSVAKPIPSTPITPVGKPGEPPQANPPTTPQPKKKSKLLIIIIITISALILIGAGILGVFWNSWFG